MKPIKLLGYRSIQPTSLGRDFMLLVDHQPLVDLLEAAIPMDAKIRVWAEKKDVKFLKKALKQSIQKEGDFDFLTCAHCHFPQDILMSPCRVEHQDDFILWSLPPPGADIYFEEYEHLGFKFHRPQYEKVIMELMEK